MREPTYRDALSHGWHLLIHHKILWIFGLFSALLGQMGVLEIVSQVVVTVKYYTYYPVVTHFPLLAQAFAEGLGKWNLSVDHKVWLLWLGCILLGFALLFVFVAIVTHGALIHYVAQYIRGKEKLKSHEGWHAGVYHFWRLLGLQIVKKIVIALLVLFVGGTTYYSIVNPSTFQTVLFALSVVLSLIVGSVVSLLVTYASGYVMVENMHLKNALSFGFNLLKAHKIVSVEVAILMLGVNVIVALVVLLLAMLFKLQIAFVAMLALATNSLALWSIGNTFSALMFTISVVALASFITVYSTSTWMYLFMKMHHHGIVPRIKLLFGKGKN